MSVPGIVQSALGDEQVAARVGLGGEDELFVTPSRILIYRGEGLLSDEDIEEYTPNAERVLVKEGRRKGKIVLEHDLEGDRSFSVPLSRLDDALHPVLAGVLNAAGVTEPGETVKQTYRFSELTLIVTSRRLVKHIGAPVWDADYEEYQFEDATGLDFEQGSVATQIVLEVGGRRERIKAPNEQAPEVRAHLEEALFEFYDVSSMAEFDAAVAEAEDDPEPEPSTATDEVAFAGGVDPLDAGGDDDSEPGTVDATHPGASVATDAGTAGTGTAESGATNTAGGDSIDDLIAETGDVGGTADTEGTEAAGSQAGAAADQAAGTTPTGTGADSTASGPDSTGTAEADATADSGPEAGADSGSEAGADSGPKAGADATATDADATAAVEEPSTEAGEALDNEELTERLDEIARAVNKQNRLLERHQETIEQLIEELQRIEN